MVRGTIPVSAAARRAQTTSDTAQPHEAGAGGGAVGAADPAHAPEAPERFGACKRQT